jgi:choline dehydrogenase-like flavoprotein
MLAQKENRVELDPEVKDKWGIPVLKIHFTHHENDYKLIADFQQKAEELFRKAGGERLGGPTRSIRNLGSSIHEVGTARMSASAKEGVLNSWCQTHDIPNLYVFGGNAFPSTGDKHPTLTFMALTARGCDHLLERG